MNWKTRLAVLGALVGVPLAPAFLMAQDTIRPIEQGVRIGITYQPGVRPQMLVLGGERSDMLDSARAILTRDLDFSDEFEMISLPQGDSMTLRIDRSGSADGRDPFVNYPLYSVLGADFVVDVAPADSALRITMYDVRGEGPRRGLALEGGQPGDRAFRLSIHQAADELVRAVTGRLGVAGTQILFVSRGRIYRTDFDGHGVEMLSTPGLNAMSPVWSPDGRRVVYTEFDKGLGPLYEMNLETKERRVIPVTASTLNYATAFHPNGETIAFSRNTEQGASIYTYNLAAGCCLQRLTVGGIFDNLSPTYSPDGQRIAHVSTRIGFAQIYVMESDGTGQELFAPFEYGVSGESNAPEWSTGGLYVTFHRDVNRTPQVFIMEVATRVVRQLSSAARNYDPTWAPDSRHLAFVSTRTGSQQVWIIDMETGRVRQLTRLGEARLPAWSPRLPERTNQ